MDNETSSGSWVECGAGGEKERWICILMERNLVWRKLEKRKMRVKEREGRGCRM